MIYLSQIKDFIQGNYNYYKDKLFNDTPEYIKEQVYYRLYICKDDCLPRKKCIYCGCPPEKKSWASSSCNHGERFPRLLDKFSWEEFKEENKIDISKIKNE